MDAYSRRFGNSYYTQNGRGASSFDRIGDSSTFSSPRRCGRNQNNPVYHSAEEKDFHQAKREVLSPRTLEAFRLEGILPNEISYK